MYSRRNVTRAKWCQFIFLFAPQVREKNELTPFFHRALA
jgi:hypothetical protein